MDEAAEVEQSWPTLSREYGHNKHLRDIEEILDDMEDSELLKIWNIFDKKNKKRIDYKETLVKLLGAIFLFYFWKKQSVSVGSKGSKGSKQRSNKHDRLASLEDSEIIGAPPNFKDLQPLLALLAKYIRDALRKKKKKYLTKKHFEKNFKTYLKDAINKRRRFLEHRGNKLSSKASNNLSPEFLASPSKFRYIL